MKTQDIISLDMGNWDPKTQKGELRFKVPPSSIYTMMVVDRTTRQWLSPKPAKPLNVQCGDYALLIFRKEQIGFSAAAQDFSVREGGEVQWGNEFSHAELLAQLGAFRPEPKDRELIETSITNTKRKMAEGLPSDRTKVRKRTQQQGVRTMLGNDIEVRLKGDSQGWQLEVDTSGNVVLLSAVVCIMNKWMPLKGTDVSRGGMVMVLVEDVLAKRISAAMFQIENGEIKFDEAMEQEMIQGMIKNDKAFPKNDHTEPFKEAVRQMEEVVTDDIFGGASAPPPPPTGGLPDEDPFAGADPFADGAGMGGMDFGDAVEDAAPEGPDEFETEEGLGESDAPAAEGQPSTLVGEPPLQRGETKTPTFTGKAPPPPAMSQDQLGLGASTADQPKVDEQVIDSFQESHLAPPTKKEEAPLDSRIQSLHKLVADTTGETVEDDKQCESALKAFAKKLDTADETIQRHERDLEKVKNRHTSDLKEKDDTILDLQGKLNKADKEKDDTILDLQGKLNKANEDKQKLKARLEEVGVEAASVVPDEPEVITVPKTPSERKALQKRLAKQQRAEQQTKWEQKKTSREAIPINFGWFILLPPLFLLFLPMNPYRGMLSLPWKDQEWSAATAWLKQPLGFLWRLLQWIAFPVANLVVWVSVIYLALILAGNYAPDAGLRASAQEVTQAVHAQAEDLIGIENHTPIVKSDEQLLAELSQAQARITALESEIQATPNEFRQRLADLEYQLQQAQAVLNSVPTIRVASDGSIQWPRNIAPRGATRWTAIGNDQQYGRVVSSGTRINIGAEDTPSFLNIVFYNEGYIGGTIVRVVRD